MAFKLFARLLDRRIAAYQRELIETHYREVDNMYRQMRGWRHDYRGHIQTMKVLAAQGDLEGIKSYLDQLDTDLNTVDLAIKTGNAMADAIINSKVSLAKSRNIPVQIDAHIPVKLKMSELDLCCILGNLFDNAMDASAELPEEERLIRVYLDMKGTQLYISFTNFTATRKQKKLGGRFATTKGEGHGFGLVRIDANDRRGKQQFRDGAAGRLPQPQQRGWGLHHRNFDPAGVKIRPIALHPIGPGRSGQRARLAKRAKDSERVKMQFVPGFERFVPEICRGRFFMVGCSQPRERGT